MRCSIETCMYGLNCGQCPDRLKSKTRLYPQKFYSFDRGLFIGSYWGKPGSKWILSKAEYDKMVAELKKQWEDERYKAYRQACLDSDRQDYKYECMMANDIEYR